MKQTQKKPNNYAFIDGQNLYLGIASLDWKLDYKRFRVYLRDKYNISEAFYFLGYVAEQKTLYEYLQRCGFTLIFKEVSRSTDGKVKGNIDVDLTMHTILKISEYDQVVLVTSDGDFSPLIEYLLLEDKLCRVLSPKRDQCSWLLRKYAKSKVDYLDSAKNKLKKHPSG